MAPSEQITAPALRELLNDAVLAGEWTLDSSRSTVTLKNRSMGGLAVVNGAFRRVTGEGTVSPAGEVSGAITVAAASIDTKNHRRDRHLRSADFFDSDNYPDITFTVEGIRLSGQDARLSAQDARPSAQDAGPSGQGITVTGTLSVRDRVRPLAFDGTAAVHRDGEVWLDAAVHVNRADFGLIWNLMGLISMENTLTIHAVFTRQ